MSTDRSIVVAADVPDTDALINLAIAVRGIPEINCFKLGFTLGLKGLRNHVETVRNVMDSPDTRIIYDHQKAANDIPPMGDGFAKAMTQAQVDAAILFPFTGPATQERWIKELQDADVGIIVGGMMTHPQLLMSEGGYIADDAPERIYKLAATLGVREFVVPGNKPEWITRIRGWIEEIIGDEQYVLWAPGFVTQGGSISESGRVAGDYFHAIVGSGIYKYDTIEEMRAAAWKIAAALD